MKPRRDVRVKSCDLHFIPVATRMPLRFGAETTTRVTCARTRVTVENGTGTTGEGWGETPLSVAWLWPSELSYVERDAALRDFCRRVSHSFRSFAVSGHPMELGHVFMEEALPALWRDFNREHGDDAALPWLADLPIPVVKNIPDGDSPPNLQ